MAVAAAGSRKGMKVLQNLIGKGHFVKTHEIEESELCIGMDKAKVSFMENA